MANWHADWNRQHLCAESGCKKVSDVNIHMIESLEYLLHITIPLYSKVSGEADLPYIVLVTD